MTSAPWLAAKRVLVGRALASEDAAHQLLPKILALPVFASDALSSNAYATEEILLVLSLAGAGALHLSIPIATAVATLMAIVVISYRQTVRAYPSGGGAYTVARENLGVTPGLIAAAALLVDYVLTVSVSIAAGAFALASLVPSLLGKRVLLSLVFIALITIMNLRGTKESGKIFAIPTYAFIASILAMLGTGLVRCLASGCPEAESAHQPLVILSEVSVFLVLRAFASGATALTGVEAIANGVPAFRGRRPSDRARNAAATLTALAVLAITMFTGLTLLAAATHVRPSLERSIVAQVAHTVFGGGWGFAVVQITTALILVLAANTAYQDFPRLSSILARDRFMPRQFMGLGDRLVFSNGIVVLAGLSSLLVIAYDADVTRLIQLYVVGVFTSFTLSQAGMVRRWRRLRDTEPRWRARATLNAIGAAATGVVLVVVAATKFVHGAWIVIIAVPMIVAGFKAINRHYMSVGMQLRVPDDRPHLRPTTRAVVLVTDLDEATMRALGYARGMRPRDVRALAIGTQGERAAAREQWAARCPTVTLDDLPAAAGDRTDAIRAYLRALEPTSEDLVTVVLPEVLRRRGLRQMVTQRRDLFLKAALLFEPGIVVTSVPTLQTEGFADPPGAIVPTRISAIVLVSAVHNATLAAVAYARSLHPTELRVVTFNVDPGESEKIMREWLRWDLDVPLDLVDSPYRAVTEPLRRLVREARGLNPDTVFTIVLPEFIVGRWWHQFLHNQTALAIKAALLQEPGVVLTSVPFHLHEGGDSGRS